MQNFVDQLCCDGLNGETVDVETCKGVGAANELDESSWKTYYRSLRFPAHGVLISRAEWKADPAACFRAEILNYQTLRGAGYDVPEVWPEVLEVHDELGGGGILAAMVVEHIEGGSPRKVSATCFKSLMKIGNALQGPAVESVKRSWARLQESASVIAPRDHQVMITHSGRIVTVDPENIGAGVTLPPWDDSLK